MRAKSRVWGLIWVEPEEVRGVVEVAEEEGELAVVEEDAELPGLSMPFVPEAAKMILFEVWAEARPRRTGVGMSFAAGLGWRTSPRFRGLTPNGSGMLRSSRRRRGSWMSSSSRRKRCDFWLKVMRAFSELQEKLKWEKREARVSWARGME